MTIDTKRLATDAGYWDEVAPEGATHWCIKVQKVNGSGFHSDSNPCSMCIRRPTKPAAPEWDGEDLPPVGCECEYMFNRRWIEAKVIGYDGPAHVVALDGFGYQASTSPSDFRHIRTKEQRQREAFKWFISDSLTDTGLDHSMAEAREIADAILSRYNLEPKP